MSNVNEIKLRIALKAYWSCLLRVVFIPLRPISGLDNAMSGTVKTFGTLSRAEFILPNLGSLIMGLAWGATPSTGLGDLAIRIVLSFAIINLSSAIGAQANTLSDRELDSRDARKKQLVEAMRVFGANRLKKVIAAEIALTLFLVLLFMLILQKPILLLLWTVGICLGCAYSLAPLRLKSRSWLAPVSLILVLAFFPVLFAYYTFTAEMNPFFLMSLTGLALTVYGVIIPTETRDYFGDKAMNIETFTVHLGLVKASITATALLTTGAALTAIAFLLEFAYSQHLFLSIILIAIPASGFVVLKQFRKLYSLSKEYALLESSSVEEKIVDLSAHNPQWIMIITQTYSAISIILLVSKFWL